MLKGEVNCLVWVERMSNFFNIFSQKARAWLCTPTPKCHNVLIGSQRATTPVKQKSKNTKHEVYKNMKQDTDISILTHKSQA